MSYRAVDYETKSYRVYFRDGNQKLFDASNIYVLIKHVVMDLGYNGSDIVKIEELNYSV